MMNQNSDGTLSNLQLNESRENHKKGQKECSNGNFYKTLFQESLQSLAEEKKKLVRF